MGPAGSTSDSDKLCRQFLHREQILFHRSPFCRCCSAHRSSYQREWQGSTPLMIVRNIWGQRSQSKPEGEMLLRSTNKSALYMPIPAGLNASDGVKWFHFRDYSLPRWGAFSRIKGYSSADNRSWKYYFHDHRSFCLKLYVSIKGQPKCLLQAMRIF
jgi:hypothetical protein